MSLPGIDGDPGEGDPSGIRSFSDQFSTRAASLTARAVSARAGLTALAPLESEAVDALRPRIVAVAAKLDDASAAATEVAGILDGYATALDGIRARAAAAIAHAHDTYGRIYERRAEALNAASEFVTGWALGWDDVLPSWMYLSDRSYLARWQGAIDDYIDARSAFHSLQSERDELDRQTAASLSGISLFSELTSSKGSAATLAAASLWAGDVAGLTADDLAALGDPDLIRQVWNGMEDEQRAALIAAAPLVIGNLDGIPIRDRVAANKINIENEIARREAEIDKIEQQRDDAVDRSYYGDQGVAAPYDGRIAEHEAFIEYYRSLLAQKVTWQDEDRVTHVDDGARVVVFDPRIDAIATYQGPIDPETGDIPSWVRHVAVSVPGTGTTMTDFADSRGRDLYAAAGPDSAIFQWAGGAFPGTIPEATQSSYANALAPRLRDFAAGISVPENGTLTVLGHSYGGATVGLAERDGLKADRILYVSAAGMGNGVGGLDDFPNTKDVPHYSMMARNDLVVGLIQGTGPGDMHGQSALTADGVTRLETGFVTSGDASTGGLEDYNVAGNGTPPAIDAHGTVFKVGTGAFDNIIGVITGGEVELFAPDQTIIAGRSVITIDGIDRDDYSPTYAGVE